MSAPIPAVKHLLERNNLDVLDVDIYEHNELSHPLHVQWLRRLEFLMTASIFMEVQSALATLGSSGSRCLISMLGVMRRLDAKSGIVTCALVAVTPLQCISADERITLPLSANDGILYLR